MALFEVYKNANLIVNYNIWKNL